VPFRLNDVQDYGPTLGYGDRKVELTANADRKIFAVIFAAVSMVFPALLIKNDSAVFAYLKSVGNRSLAVEDLKVDSIVALLKLISYVDRAGVFTEARFPNYFAIQQYPPPVIAVEYPDRITVFRCRSGVLRR